MSRGPGHTRVLCDVMLGDLARILRMCGYDAAYSLDRGVEDDAPVRALARDEDRVLLTRDVSLAARTPGAVCLSATDTDAQLRELRDAGFVLELGDPARCGRCNGELAVLAGDESTPADVPDPGETAVWRCRDCGQHFWKGSHWDDVRARLPN